MSILVKGMEMPTAPVLFCIHPDGKVFADFEGGWREYKAIPVQPYGRLIDAGKMRESIRRQTALLKLIGGELAEIAETLEKGFLQEIDNAPTIIPAEEGE